VAEAPPPQAAPTTALPTRSRFSALATAPAPAGLNPVPGPDAALRWSDPASWGGTLPPPGAQVVIPSGRAVVLDTDPPPLASLRIEGALYVAERDLRLRAGSIVVSGRFQVGTPTVPHAQRLVVTLTGEPSDTDVSGTGSKQIGVLAGGQLELHGHRHAALAWAKLAEHAAPGDTAIELTDAADWRAGDRIVIAPSGFDAHEAEAVTVTAVDGRRVTFTPALRHRHWGRVMAIEGRAVDHRAAVGLLTRDIVIEGDEGSAATQFGGHVMVMPGGFARVAGVEFRRMGQMGRMGRYPLHWHWVDRHPQRGVSGQGQYALGNSFHGSFHRAIVVHGTNGIRAEANVAHDVHGHIYVPAEDGDEEDGVWRWNLGVLARKPLAGRNAFPVAIRTGPATGTTLQTEHKPSVFWSRTLNHTLEGNVAAGSEGGNGFFFDGFLQFDPENPVTAPLQVQKPARAIVFRHNVAHSHCGRDEAGRLAFEGPVYSGAASMHGLLVHRAVVGRLEGDLVFEGLVAFKNCRSGAWMEHRRELLKDAVLTDNNWALTPEHGPRIQGLLAVGRSANDIGGAARERGGLAFNDRIDAAFEMVDATFVGMASGVITWVDEFEVGGGRVARLRLVDSVPYGSSGDLRGPSRGSLLDEDGSLTGAGAGARLSLNPLESRSMAVSAPTFGAGATPGSVPLYVTPGR
jgi:cell migration-inducing and hyaluronan-binding protein